MKRIALFWLCFVFLAAGLSGVRAEEKAGYGPLKTGETRKMPGMRDVRGKISGLDRSDYF